MNNNKEIQIRCRGSRELSYDKLKTFQGNLKAMTKENCQKLKNSILKYGWCAPVFVWGKDWILDGHGRLLVLSELLKDGYSIGHLPIVDIEADTKKQAGEILLAINSKYQTITDQGLYEFMADMEIGVDELGGFALDMDLERFGNEYFTENGLTDPDEIPEVTEPIAKVGDLWLLGEHRLLCGDATKAEDVNRLMGDKKADMVFTDPPYNVDYARKITNDNFKTNHEFYQFLYDAISTIKPHVVGDVYIFMSSSELHTLQKAFVDCGGHWSTFIIWVKNNFTLGRSNYQRQYEPILYGWFEGTSHYWSGIRKLSDVYKNNINYDTDGVPLIRMESLGTESDIWEYPKPSISIEHPTMKPVALIERAIVNSSQRGGVILDTFAGSGSTVMASEKSRRICYAIEIAPHYTDVIIKRWENYTGRKAELTR